MLHPIITLMLPHLMQLLAVILTGVIGSAAAVAKKRWGLDIEARHREALHTALLTAAGIAIEKGMSKLNATEFVINYAKASVPDALSKLKPSETVFQNLALSKLAEIKVRQGA